MNTPEIYETPRTVTDLADCYFYHTIDIPGYGRVEGEWDLRAGIDAYLGGVDCRGKRVLEIGTASGFVCFHLERQGAELVAFDLAENQTWDVVPFARHDSRQQTAPIQSHLRKIHNAFWLGHGAFQSHSRKVHSTVYAIPEAIGPVDVTTFGCVLLHVRDPFLALANAARLTRQTVVVTEPLQKRRWSRWLLGLSGLSSMVFMPDFHTGKPRETWWFLPPKVVQQFLGVLGFEKTEVTYHSQLFMGRPNKMYTVVGHRT